MNGPVALTALSETSRTRKANGDVVKTNPIRAPLETALTFIFFPERNPYSISKCLLSVKPSNCVFSAKTVRFEGDFWWNKLINGGLIITGVKTSLQSRLSGLRGQLVLETIRANFHSS